MSNLEESQRANRTEGVARRQSVACLLAVLCATLIGALSSAATAAAFTQRGHIFSFAFASKGEGSGELVRPEGIAVSEASGDVYVVDAGNNRIERFGPRGEFIAAWGWGVSDGKAEYEICTTACKAGIAGEGAGELDVPSAIAIDNSTGGVDPSRGDIYVVADTSTPNNVVEKYAPGGEPLGVLSLNARSGPLGGIALDADGIVSVSELGASEIARFSDAAENQQLPGTTKLELGCEVDGFAVDATDEEQYVAHRREDLESECPERAATTKNPALIAKLTATGELQREALDVEDTSAVAADLASNNGSPLGAAARGDVYLDNLTSVAAFSSDGSLIERFGSPEVLSAGAGLAVNSELGDLYVADSKRNRIDVFEPEPAGAPTVDELSYTDESPTSTRLRGMIDPHGVDTHYYFQYGAADCRDAPAACTDVPALPGTDLGAGFGSKPVATQVHGLTPGTTYFYRLIATNEHGLAESAQTLGTFTTLPMESALADDRVWELVSPPEKHGALIYPIGGSTENGGPAEGPIQAARDGSAITYAANAPIGESVAGNRSLEATQVVSTRGSEAWSTSDIATPSEVAEGLKASAGSEYRLFSSDLGFGLAEPFGPYAATGNHMQTPALAQGASEEERGLYLRSAGNCDVVLDSCFQPLVNVEEDSAGQPFGGELEFRGGTPDLRHVVFSSDVALTSSAPSAPGLYEWSAGEPAAEALQLISVLPGNQKAAPDEPEPALGDFISQISSARNAISTDGRRVFWSAVNEEKETEITRLYMRDTEDGQTIVLNAAQGIKELSAAERAYEEVHFRTASADGSRVFFTDNFPLTAQSRLQPSEEGPSDLYVCEISEGPSGPQCKLTDLTVDPGYAIGETADVVGTLPGASEDGSYVYFVANGVLSEAARASGATEGSCARPSDKHPADPSAHCNLYVEHYSQANGEWEAPQFIAQLSQEDSPDWGGTGSQSLGALTSRVSPNGGYLAFMSKEPLTGYDNIDQSPAASGARDEEVYLYDADDGRLTCASCNPSGAPPSGVLDHERTGEGTGLLIDRFGVWQEDRAEEQGAERRAIDHWLAGSIPGWTPDDVFEAFYQSRYLSNEGRLFFDSSDTLVPADANGKEDVYEYEPQSVGSCQSTTGCVSLISSGDSEHESAFLDASESGDDVFFLTSQPLLSSDHDTAFDVYDAHVCSESSPCLQPPAPAPLPCDALESCRPALPSTPVFAGPSGSATTSHPGNQPASQAPASKTITKEKPKPLTRAQMLARALRICQARHRHSKARRVSCERVARRRYATPKSDVRKRHARGAKRKRGRA